MYQWGYYSKNWINIKLAVGVSQYEVYFNCIVLSITQIASIWSNSNNTSINL